MWDTYGLHVLVPHQNSKHVRLDGMFLGLAVLGLHLDCLEEGSVTTHQSLHGLSIVFFPSLQCSLAAGLGCKLSTTTDMTNESPAQQKSYIYS
ncbi:hypothetical protein E2C01_025580 [Portunus trituberculatus]|uniref:Uncharacterized protein n=1 Tax=Portunus trituberculatus TaxID=210409 RepID=A0A5B7EDN8_PORTR|nr:hypothetical protein [Portunus trituberculatus]